MSWSALTDYGISWSFSLTFWSFLVRYNQNKSVLLCKLLNFLSVHSNSEFSHNIYCYSRSILVEYVRFRKPMTPNLQADVHFRDALEHLHLLDMHIVLHKQPTRCMHTNVIASKHFQRTSSQYVPSCHKSVVSVSLFSRSTITWST